MVISNSYFILGFIALMNPGTWMKIGNFIMMYKPMEVDFWVTGTGLDFTKKILPHSMNTKGTYEF